MIGNRIVVEEEDDEEEDEEEDEDYWPHSQNINYELQAYKYVSKTLFQEMLRRTNYRCEECGKICSILSPWFYETPNEGGRVEPDNLLMLCISCGHEYGLKNS